MIPIKLSLQNFMCYRDNVPPLHFGGIHTVSVCGNNGNGKSALIDAITWALWGQTRAKHDDDLIHTGQTETEVEFEFAIGEQTYRILRKHSRPKKRRASGQTILEFQIAANGAFKSITGNTISQTQQKICPTSSGFPTTMSLRHRLKNCPGSRKLKRNNWRAPSRTSPKNCPRSQPTKLS